MLPDARYCSAYGVIPIGDFPIRRLTTDELLDKLQTQLSGHEKRIDSDPQSNPVKLLAYDVSKDVEEREIAFKDIEALVKTLSDKGALSRARRLRERAGLDRLESLQSQIGQIAKAKAAEGFAAFRDWMENPGQGIVLTAHPTFSLSRDIRATLGEVTERGDNDYSDLAAHLTTLPYLPKRAPTLQEEHVDTQQAIKHIQTAIRAINAQIISVAEEAFPKTWTELTPNLISLYSWVGYDIDGRTDISWGDALRLRLSEKSEQLSRYLAIAIEIQSKGGVDAPAEKAIEALVDKIADAHDSALRDLELFNKDLTNMDNLVAAANNLTRSSTRRFLHLGPGFPLINKAIKGASADTAKELIGLRALMKAFGLGTSRIHFRLNTRHVMSGVKAIFGIKDQSTDNRTLLLRASELTKNVKPKSVNFASLALEKSTAHQQMILTAQIHKYIDSETPIRLLIAECEDSLTPLGMLYIARLYGLDKHLDISPLFETADALNNGGRIISKMLSNPVYRAYVQERGVFAIQTGFSDAGRFMGQIPATLAIERLQSHFAAAMAKHGVEGVTSIVFNTHGESMGRGGHPGDIKGRVDYAMSPWAIRQFEKRELPLCHETSFQGGDGFLWFQTEKLAAATVTSLLAARHSDRSGAEDDVFYQESDFSWDMYRTMSSAQDSLYHDPNYVTLLSGFGQNLLIPTGSRAAQRSKGDLKTEMFNPRQLRAIPHNSILQQFGSPANIFYGMGRAASIDPEKFISHFQQSHRARSIFTLVIRAMQRSNLSILTAYGRLFDPGFWVSRALSGNEPRLAEASLIVSRTMSTQDWRARLMDLANRLRMDMFDSQRYFEQCETCGVNFTFEDHDTLKILHALRLAVIMKMMILATDLPSNGGDRSTQLNVLQRLQSFQIDSILTDLKERYPASGEALDWADKLQEKSEGDLGGSSGFPHISQTIIKPLERASELVRQITIAITHHYDAFG